MNIMKVANSVFSFIAFISFLVCVLPNGEAQTNNAPSPQQLRELYGHALDAIAGMGLRMQALLDDDTSKTENFIVSPVSATTLLAQIMLGVDSEFADELFQLLSLPLSQMKNDRIRFYGRRNSTYILPYSTLHLQLSQLLRALASSPASKYILNHRNAVFFKKGVTLKEQFVRCATKFYQSDLVELDFVNDAEKSYDLINRWGEEHTHGLIKRFLAQPPTADTVAILANALYFKADWKLPFSDELNQVNYFNVSANKRVNVTYMYNFLEGVPYGVGVNYKVVCLPYTENQLGMYLVLPDAPVEEYDIREFAQKLRVSDLRRTIEQAQIRDVNIIMPKMYIIHKLSLLQHLQKYRAYKEATRKLRNQPTPIAGDPIGTLESRIKHYEQFSVRADKEPEPIYLSNAVENGIKAPINNIVQHIVLSVNEKGTEAAAISAGTIDYSGGSKNFRVTKPFLFFIRHEPTTAIVFWGTIKNPSP